MQSKNKKFNRVRLYLALFAMTITFIVLAGEIMARYFVQENRLPSPPLPSKIDPYSPNPYLIGMRPFMHFHIPGAQYTQARSYYSVEYSINSSGFRGPEILPKSEGKKRAIIIGDSIVEGHGCPFNSTFTYRLGEKAEHLNWEVLNLGVQGGSPSYFAANIDRYMATEPDAAIIVLFENDLYDDRAQEKSYFNKPFLDTPEKLYPGHNKDFYLSDWSRLFMLIQRSYRTVRPDKLEKILKRNSTVNTRNDEQEQLEKIASWLVAPSMFDTQWEMSSEYLDYTAKAFNKKKIPVFIVYISLGGTVPGQDKSYSVHTNTFNHKVEEWSRSKNIPFFSLVPLISKAIAEVPVADLMIKDDGHPTPKTHQIFADKIWQWLEDVGR